MPEKSSTAPNRRICRSSSRPGSSSSSISTPPRRSASPCRHRSSPAPTRSSNEPPQSAGVARRGGGGAMGGLGATAASDRLAVRYLGRRFCAPARRLSPWARRDRLRRRAKSADRISLGGRRCALLPALAADLVRANVEVIVTSGGPQPASAAMQATNAIPIVASAAGGLVKHFNRPEGNLTGLSFLTGTLTPKRFELLVELVPGVAIAVLARPAYSEYEPDRKQVENAAQVLGVEARFVTAGTDTDLEPAFASLAELRA